MSAHHDEQQELENAKHLWKNGGQWLFTALIIAALAYLGYTIYQNQQQKQHQQAALQASKIGQDNNQLILIQQEYPNSPATTQASLEIAADLFNKGQYDQAIEQYRWVLTHNKIPVFQAAAVQNLANVYLQQQNYDEALKILDTPVAENFQAIIEENKGDVYATQGKKQEAILAYQSALDKLAENEINRELIQAKLNIVRAD